MWLAAQSRLPTSMRFLRPAARFAGVAERTARALEQCGLGGRRSVLSERLSYGEQRQLEIGMMLATEPELLLLDEPLAGMGHDEARSVLELLRGLSRGRTLVLIEHDMDAVFSIADTVTVLVDGRVLETGTPERIRGGVESDGASLARKQPQAPSSAAAQVQRSTASQAGPLSAFLKPRATQLSA